MDKWTVSTKRVPALTLILSFLWINASCQLLVPVTSPGATPKPTSSSFSPSSCNYLVSRTNGVCMVTTNAVQTQLNAIKDDNFRARLQYMSTNSVLQTRITKLESDDAKLSLRVDGLQRDLQSLRSRVATTGTGTGTGTSINQITNSLQQSIQGVDNRVTGLAAAVQRDAVSQAQTNAAFQQQLTQLLQDNQQLTINNNRLTQELQRLNTQVQALATQCSAGCGAGSSPAATAATTASTTASTTPAATPSPAPTINPARLAKIEQDILNLDNLLQQTNADLGILDRLVTVNHTQELRNQALELRSHDGRITQNQNEVNKVYQALQILNTQTVPNIQADISTLTQDSQALKTLTTQLQAAQKILLNDTLFMKLDVGQLQRDMQGVQTTQGRHRKAIDELNVNLIGALLTAYPQLSTVQSNVNSVLNGGSASSTSPPSTTKGSIIIPPTLPAVTGGTTGSTTQKASTTGGGGGLIVPPTLFPPPG